MPDFADDKAQQVAEKQLRSCNIAASPYPIEIKLEKTALLLIDFQRDFIEKGGYMEMLGNDPNVLHTAIPHAAQLLYDARKLNMKVIFTREGHSPDLSDCPPNKLELRPPGTRIGDAGILGRFLVRGEAGHQIIPDLAPLESEMIIDKSGRDSFFNTSLDEELRKAGIDTLLVTGVTTEVCVETTVRTGFDRGYKCLCVSDGCASFVETRHQASLDTITGYGGIFGYAARSEDIHNELKAYY